MSNISTLVFAFLLLQFSLEGQSPLDNYIEEGFRNNLMVREQNIALEKSLSALKEAQSLFLPSVVFQSDYFLAGGGRTVDFPAGDLLNPVYSTLNQLAGGGNFPQLQNERILLNPHNFYDVKFRTSAPLFNLELNYNKRIKQHQVSLQQIEIELYQVELAKDIKVAYFQYLQANEAIKIYESALVLVQEGKRINESLFNNDKVNRTVLLRSESEIARYKSLVEISRQNAKSAKAYFNFLLNKHLDAEIEIDQSYNNVPVPDTNRELIANREELQKLRLSKSINAQLEGLSKSFIIPKFSTFLDLGSQGFDGRFDRSTRYYFFGISLQWDLYQGGRNNHQVKQIQLESRILQSREEYVEQQLNLQFSNAIHEFSSSIANYDSAMLIQASSRQFYKDILKLYKEGKALFIEVLDAQNQLVQSELQANIFLFDAYIKAALIERAGASFKNKF